MYSTNGTEKRSFVETYMNYNPINLQQKLSKFTEYWSPKVVAQMNDYQFYQ